MRFKDQIFFVIFMVPFVWGTCATAGNLGGTVTESVGGTPLSGIDLDLFDSNFNSVALNASTDANGTYTYSGLPAGNYFLRVDPDAADGYVDQYSGGVFLKSQALPITVPAMGTITLNFTLDLGNNIQGQLTIEGIGSPAANIDLDVFASNGELITSVNATTDGAGNYILGALPPGEYFLRADPAPGQFLVERFYLNGDSVPTGTPLQITGSGDLTGIDFQIERGGILSGVVTQAGVGNPLAGFDLDLFTATGSFVSAGAVTTSTGYYEIGAVPPGQYLVRVDPDPLSGYVRTFYPNALLEIDATPVSVSAGMVTTSVDIAIPLGGTIVGTVTENSSTLPVQDVDLDVFDSFGTRLPITAKTDAIGFYRLGGLPAGEYTVRADPVDTLGLVTEFFNGTPFHDQAAPVTVLTGVELMNIDFSLDAGGYIEGLVLSQSGGTPIAGMDLDLFSETGNFLASVDSISSSTGYYRLGPIATGNWIVQADSSPLQGFVDQFFNLKSSFLMADPIAVTASVTTSGIDFSLFAGGTISGTIRSGQNNHPLADIDLDVFLSDGTRVEADARTDLSGQYILGPLPPGQYVLRADPLDSTGYLDEFFEGAETFSLATQVTVTANQDTPGIDFNLAGGISEVSRWSLYE